MGEASAKSKERENAIENPSRQERNCLRHEGNDRGGVKCTRAGVTSTPNQLEE
jgi:hypothetical protein